MNSKVSPPLIGVPACFRDLGGMRMHYVDDAYVNAIVDSLGGIPVAIPALGDRQDIGALLARLDGLLVTGSASNVDPARYGGAPSDPGTMHDALRDASNLPLIPAAVDAGLPLLAICRGFQELNVAYGGSLHEKIHEVPGRMDHRAPAQAAEEIMFAPRHAIRLTEGGLLRRLLGADRAIVNSVHWQGVDRVGGGLAVEAVAEDGTIEALRAEGAKSFALAVQWHPEYRSTEDPVSRVIFAAFGEAIGRHRHSSSVAA